MTTRPIKLWRLVALTALLTALLLSVVLCLHSKAKRLSTTNETLSAEVSHYTIRVDSLEEVVYESSLIVADRERDLILSRKQIERIKALNIRNVQVIGELNLRLQAYRDSLIIRTGTDTVVLIEYRVDSVTTGYAVPVGSEWSWSDRWARSYAGIDSLGLGYSGFEVKELPLDIVLGSRGLFRKDFVSAVSSANPYLTIDKSNMQVVQKKKAKPFIVGLALGVVATAVVVSVL